MKRRLVTGALLATASPFAALSQVVKWPSGRIGILVVGAGPMALAPQGLLKGLEEHSLLDGRDFLVRYFDEASLPLATDLQRERTDIIFAVGSRGVNMARAASRSIPTICIDLESEPVTEGLIKSFSRPSGNLTGMFLDQPALAAKWLQFLSEALPGLSRIAVLRQTQLAPGQWRAVEAQALRNRIGVQPFDFEASTLDRIFADIVATRPEALIILSSPLVVASRARIATLASDARLPSITMFRVYAEAGGLMAYGPDPQIMGHRAASYVVRVLRGTSAGDLPVEQPSRFELAVNVNTARALGVTLPLWIQAGADTLID